MTRRDYDTVLNRTYLKRFDYSESDERAFLAWHRIAHERLSCGQYASMDVQFGMYGIECRFTVAEDFVETTAFGDARKSYTDVSRAEWRNRDNDPA